MTSTDQLRTAIKLQRKGYVLEPDWCGPDYHNVEDPNGVFLGLFPSEEEAIEFAASHATQNGVSL